MPDSSSETQHFARIEAMFLDPNYMPLLLVEVQLAVPAGIAVISTFGVVDSGSDSCLVNGDLLAGSGIGWEDLPPGPGSMGAGGSFETRTAVGDIAYEGHVFTDGSFAVCDPANELPFVLLGMSDFFKHYKVEFEWDRDPPVFHVKGPRPAKTK